MFLPVRSHAGHKNKVEQDRVLIVQGFRLALPGSVKEGSLRMSHLGWVCPQKFTRYAEAWKYLGGETAELRARKWERAQVNVGEVF